MIGMQLEQKHKRRLMVAMHDYRAMVLRLAKGETIPDEEIDDIRTKAEKSYADLDRHIEVVSRRLNAIADLEEAARLRDYTGPEHKQAEALQEKIRDHRAETEAMIEKLKQEREAEIAADLERFRELSVVLNNDRLSNLARLANNYLWDTVPKDFRYGQASWNWPKYDPVGSARMHRFASEAGELEKQIEAKDFQIEAATSNDFRATLQRERAKLQGRLSYLERELSPPADPGGADRLRAVEQAHERAVSDALLIDWG